MGVTSDTHLPKDETQKFICPGETGELQNIEVAVIATHELLPPKQFLMRCITVRSSQMKEPRRKLPSGTDFCRISASLSTLELLYQSEHLSKSNTLIETRLTKSIGSNKKAPP